MKHWKTTITGVLSGLPLLFIGIVEKDPKSIVAGLGLIIGGLSAKDHDK